VPTLPNNVPHRWIYASGDAIDLFCLLALQLKYLPIPLTDKEGYPMTRIQFGWSLPSGPPQGMSRNAYMDSVYKGFELIKGHFDSFWFVDHLQSDNNPLLEGLLN